MGVKAWLLPLTPMARVGRVLWRTLAIGVIILSTIGTARTARADDAGRSTPSASPRDVALERFQRGLELASQQLWDVALAEFLASRAIFPTRSATRNAAVALVHLRRFAEACEQYRDLLRLFGDEMPSAQREAARAELAAAVAQTGELAITSTEAAAVVLVDGTLRGTTPLRETVRIDPGTHRVRLEKPGFGTREVTVTVARSVTVPVHDAAYGG
jgi:tetratricopeptide (TPR) repeat protein